MASDRWVMILGKSDNAKPKEEINKGDIVRFLTEEVLKTENPKFQNYPRYSTYISRYAEKIPEKNISDSLEVLDKLSQFQPKRMPIEEITRIEQSVMNPDLQQEQIGDYKPSGHHAPPNENLPGEEVVESRLMTVISEQIDRELVERELRDLSYKYPASIADIMRLAEIAKEEIQEWVNKKRIPGKIYKELAKPGEPLPKSLYVDQKKGEFWAQLHIRSITPEQYESVKSGKTPLWKVLIGNSYHTDIRCNFEDLPKLVQVVVTEENIQNMIKTFKGERRETAGGINVSHSMVVSKPSGEPPGYIKKSLDEETIPALDEEGAKIAASLDLGESSYWIQPGGIGATAKDYAYMMHICSGKIIEGVVRDDLKEWFLYKEKANDDILNGKFTIKCLNDGTRNRFEIWKSISNPLPLDPIMHSCTDSHWLIPSEDVKGIGREVYRNDSQELYKRKLS